jgi:hypothetical protein
LVTKYVQKCGFDEYKPVDEAIAILYVEPLHGT